MKRILFVFLLLTLSSNILLAQGTRLTRAARIALMNQLDSVLIEGNLLYKYEKVAWISNDLALENPIVKEEFHGYLTYEEQGEIKTIILGENLQTCVAEYVFENNFNQPKSVEIGKRELSNKEKTLVDVREKILENIFDKNEYEVTVPIEGYNLNFILLPFANKYKLYIITGTTESNLVPLGNDYIFIANENGEIESWHKFHSILIPGYSTIDGQKVRGLIHTHLPTTPLMTATDICTFMLYAPFFDLETLTVLHGRIRVAMKYSLKENQITISTF